MSRNVFTLVISVVFMIINLTNEFDFRNGMSFPWSSLNRNRVRMASSAPSSENKTIGEAKQFLKQMEKVTGKKIDTNLDIINKLTTKAAADFTEQFVDMKVDHFSFDDSRTFSMRYLVKDRYFKKDIANTPILFYCGNEGAIQEFWNNSGFITETLAEEFNGLVIFGEHRFFGKSFPLGGAQDFDIKKNKYLTVEQALADFVELLRHVRKSLGLDESHPIIAFGGSYGGMLAAWGRMKFPHVFKGAIASSAPILLFEDIDRISNSFFRIVTETYKRYDSQCPVDIRQGFSTLEKIKNTPNNENLIKEVNSIFNICSPLKNSTEIKLLEDTIEDAIVALAQYNYPYETSFLNPTPAYPVRVACEKIQKFRNESSFSSDKSLLYFGNNNIPPLMQSSIGLTLSKFNQMSPEMKDHLNYLKEAVSVFFNYTGSLECLDIGNNQTEVPSLNGWSYMACSEMVMPMQKDGLTDMFNPQKWNLEEFTKDCASTWSVDVRPEWAYNFFGGRNFQKEIENYSNILFTNGLMDPWNAGCPHIQSTSSVFVVEADSAHHLDLRLPSEKDPESIVQARKLTRELIKKWIIQ